MNVTHSLWSSFFEEFLLFFPLLRTQRSLVKGFFLSEKLKLRFERRFELVTHQHPLSCHIMNKLPISGKLGKPRLISKVGKMNK